MTQQRSKQFLRVIVPLIFIIVFSLQLQAQPGDSQNNGRGRVPENVAQEVQTQGQARVIVSLRDPGRSAQHRLNQDEIEALQQRVETDLEGQGFQTQRSYAGIPALAGVMNARAIQALENNPNVEFVMLDLPMQTDGNGREGVGVLAAHAQGFTGQGVTVAVVDTGIKQSHLAFEGIEDAIVGEFCATQGACYPFGDDTGESAADQGQFGHGTVVTDIITGPGGYAPDTNIVAVRVLDDNGGGYLSDWLAGLDWVWDHHVDYSIDIVNMSLGTVAAFSMDGANGCDADNPLFEDVADVLQDLYDHYIPVFVASGNFGARPDGGIDMLPAPACFSRAISVAATYSQDYGRFPPTGSYADASPGFPDCHDQFTGLDRVACFSSLPADLAAPGVHTAVLPNGQEVVIFGTSFASPAAAGIAAMIKQQPPIPNLGQPNSVNQLLALMQATGSPTSLNEDPGGTGEPVIPPLLVNAQAVAGEVTVEGCYREVPAGDVYGAAGLVNAINAANARSQYLYEVSAEQGQPNSDKPVLICLAPGASYELATPIGSSGAGLPPIYAKVAILGNGATIRRANFAPDFRIFNVEDTSNTDGMWTILSLGNVTLENGSVSGEGGAIYVPQDANGDVVQVQLYGVTLRENAAATSGGAIFARSDVIIEDSAFISNQSRWGGAINIADGALNVVSTLFDQNSATTSGGALFFQGIVADIGGSVFTNNIADDSGGAIQTAQPLGGGSEGLHLSAIRFEGNLASGNLGNSGGGAIHNEADSMPIIIERSSFIRNVALFRGGAVYLSGFDSYMDLAEVQFVENTVSGGTPGGGAIYLLDSLISIQDAEFIANQTIGFGAVFYNSGGTIYMQQATFQDQTKSTATIYADDPAGNPGFVDAYHITVLGQRTSVRSFWIQNSEVYISASTFVSTEPLTADGPGGFVALRNVLMADAGCTAVNSGTVYTEGLNIEGWSAGVTPTQCGGAEQYTWDPTNPANDALKLGELADNGGMTRTISIAQDSVAADRIPNNAQNDQCYTLTGIFLLRDQRGALRDTRCDVGAFEYVLPKPQDDFVTAAQSVLRGFDEYGFDDDVIDVTPESGEAAITCGDDTVPPDGDPYHLSVSGQSIFRGLSAGQSIFRGLASGGVFMDVDASGGEFGSGGIYTGEDVGNLEEVDCIDGQTVLEIPGDAAEDELPFRIVLWNENSSQTNLKLKISDITFKGCGAIIGIPALECEALLQFYYDTGGENWIMSKYWLDTDRPCSPVGQGGWFGVQCSNGHVSGLNLVNNNVILPDNWQDDYFGYFQSLIQIPTGDGIVVTTTSMAQAADGLCSLIEAIITANTNTASGGGIDGECMPNPANPAGPPPFDNEQDIITLGKDKVYILNQVYAGIVGTPTITGDVIIEGNRSRIERSFAPGTPQFALLELSNTTLPAVMLRDLTLRNGFTDAAGGAIRANGGALTVEGVNFVNNRAGNAGGAIAAFNTELHVMDSIFYNNVALTNGGAIDVSDTTNFTVDRSAFINNRGNASGGAIIVGQLSEGAVIVNSTFSRNASGNNGAAILAYETLLDLQFLTFAENIAPPSNGVLVVQGAGNPVTAYMTGLLMANNEGNNCQEFGVGSILISNGYNISDEGSCGAFFSSTSDLLNIDPLLGPMEARRPIHIPQLGSPALDRVPEADCLVVDDQTGKSRPLGAGCDVGAFEWFNRAPTVVDDVYNAAYQGILAVDAAQGVLANDSDADNNPLTVIFVTPPAHAKEGTFQWYPNGSFVYEPEDGFHGEDDTFEYQASDGVETTKGTVTIHVAPKPLAPPDHLSVVEADEMGMVTDSVPTFPTLRFTHREKESDTQVPGLWYQIQLNRGATVVLNVWLDAAVFCEGLICQIPLDQTNTPEAITTLPAYGLINGSYSWMTRSWSGPGNTSPWSAESSFTVMVPIPPTPTVRDVYPNNGAPIIEWLNNSLALYYRVRIRNLADTTLYEQWFTTGQVCSTNLCSVMPNIVLGQGTFKASIQAWGPGGMTPYGAEEPFTQVVDPPPVLDPSAMTVLHPNSGEPVFVWPQVANATWYNLILTHPNTGIVKNLWYQMGDICQNNACTAKPIVFLTNLDGYGWVFRSWGPGGFNGGDANLNTSGSFNVSALLPTEPELVIPTGTADSLTPMYSWGAVADATWFQVVIKQNNSTTVHNAWVSAASVGCGPGDSAAFCLYQPDLPLINGAAYSWDVRGYSPAGSGPWAWDPAGGPPLAGAFTVAVP